MERKNSLKTTARQSLIQQAEKKLSSTGTVPTNLMWASAGE